MYPHTSKWLLWAKFSPLWAFSPSRRRQGRQPSRRGEGGFWGEGSPLVPLWETPSQKSKVARKSKVEKVGKVAGKSKKSKVESRLRVATRVGRVDSRESRRVAQVSRPDILCTIVGVVVNIRCNHIFGLVLIAKVVFTEEDA